MKKKNEQNNLKEQNETEYICENHPKNEEDKKTKKKNTVKYHR